MAKHKQPRGKGGKTFPATNEKWAKTAEQDAAREQPSDPLRAFPADPPRPNRALLIVSAALFAIWFCFLAYVALRG